MHEHLIKWLSDIVKKIERGVPHKLAPRRGCLDYSKVYCDVRKRWFLAWNQNRYITYYILHIQYTNSVLVTSTGLLYISPHFFWWHQLNHCVSLVRNLPTSILVHASVSLLTFHTHTIRQRFWRHYGLRILRAADSRTFPFPHFLVFLVFHGMIEAAEQHRKLS